MTLTRRQTNRPMPTRSALERVFGEWPLIPVDMSFNEQTPAMDVRETNDSYVVEIDLPGVNPDDAEVVIEGRTLTIKGRYEQSQEREEDNFLLRERRRGQFLRAVALPGMIDVDKVESRYEDGQLIVTLPKSEHSKARKIAIGKGEHNGA